MTLIINPPINFITNEDAISTQHIQELYTTGVSTVFTIDPLVLAWPAGIPAVTLQLNGIREKYYGNPLNQFATVNFTFNPGLAAPSQMSSLGVLGTIASNVLATNYSTCCNPISWDLANTTYAWFILWQNWFRTLLGDNNISYVNIDVVPYHSAKLKAFPITHLLADIIVSDSIIPAISMMSYNPFVSIFNQPNMILFSLKTIALANKMLNVLNSTTMLDGAVWYFIDIIKVGNVNFKILTTDTRYTIVEPSMKIVKDNVKIGFLCMWGSPNSKPLSANWNDMLLNEINAKWL